MSDIENISADDKNLAVIAHLGGTMFSIFPSLLIWLTSRRSNIFVSEQAREALNFQITLIILYFIAYVLTFVLIGFVLIGILWFANIVLCIFGAISSSKAETYRYPLTLRLIN